MITYQKNDKIGVIEFNDPDAKVNLLSDRNLDALAAILEDIRKDADVRALFFVSNKKNAFIAGADIRELAAIQTCEEALRLCKKGQDLFNNISDLPIPKFALINGACIGGGLELALACDYVFATKNKKVKVGLPEVKLGIVPGFGGIHRLREKIGTEKANELINTGRLLNAGDAKRLNIIDKVIPESKEFLFEELLKLSSRPRKFKNQPQLDRKERELFAEKILQEPARNALSSYLLVSKYKSYPWLGIDAGGPLDIRRCAIVGAGTMGKGIAYLVSSETDIYVNLRDTDKPTLRKSKLYIKDLYKDALKRRILYDDEAKLKFKNISFDSAPFKGFDIVIESITEDIPAKKMLFAEIEKELKGGSILATNTSCISIEELSKSLKDARRFLGMHFFNPTYKMKLTEVIPTRFTSKAVLQTAIRFLRALRRIPIIVRDSPGFLVNRMVLPYLNEAVFMAQDGFLPEDIEDAMLKFGMPMGPFRLIREIGPAVVYKAGRVLEQGLGNRVKAPDIGIIKSRDRASALKKPKPDLVVERLLRPIRREAEMCMEENIVSSREIIDLALLLGIGFPGSKRIWTVKS